MDLLEIERIYNKELLNVTHNKIRVWFLLRSKFDTSNLYKATGYHSDIRTRSFFVLFKNFFYGFWNLFKLSKFRFYFFSNTNKRFKIDDKYTDVYFEKISDCLGSDKSLFIEFAEAKHLRMKNVQSRRIISDLPFKAFSLIFSLFINTRKTKNIYTIYSIAENNGLKINIKKELKVALGEYYFYKMLLKLFKPKAVFVICYYSKMPLVAAAHDVSIPIYEAQHGVINENNPYYNSIFHKHIDYFPDFLLSYGNDLKELQSSNFIFPKEKIIPVGSYYLNYILNSFEDNYLNSLKKRFDKVVCVTSQGIFFNELMCFVEILSIKYTNYLFILKLKRDENPSKYLRENIVLLNQYDIYKILKYSDYNITIYSMAAIEADFLNAYNVLLNINGLSQKHLPSEINSIIVDPANMDKFKFPLNPKRNSTIEFFQLRNYSKAILEFCNNLEKIYGLKDKN